ncbi:MAG: hypothetical protein MHMPM18_000733 [Marteilia pararefringens]
MIEQRSFQSSQRVQYVDSFVKDFQQSMQRIRKINRTVGKLGESYAVSFNRSQSQEDSVANFGNDSCGFEMPCIAVIGEKNCGKSSLVESLIGIGDFIPKQTKTVNLTTLTIKTVYTPDIKNFQIVFDHIPEEIYEDLSKVRQVIERESIKSQNLTRNYDPRLLFMTIYSAFAIDLCIIDTSPLISVNISNKLENVALRSIEHSVFQAIAPKNVLILALCQSNVDLATSGSLAMAKKADITLSRTIGVITKLDLQENIPFLANILENKNVFIKNGFHGIINDNELLNSQKEELVNMDGDNKENLFINKHPLLLHLSQKYGIRNLKKRIMLEIYSFLLTEMLNVKKYINVIHLNLMKEQHDFRKAHSHLSSNSNDPEIHMIRRILDISSIIGKLLITNFNVSRTSGVAFIKDLALLNKSPLVDCFKIIINVLPHLISKKTPNLNAIVLEFISRKDKYKLDPNGAMLEIVNSLSSDHDKVYLKCFDKLGGLFIAKIDEVLKDSFFDPFIISYIKNSCDMHINSLVTHAKQYFLKLFDSFQCTALYNNIFTEIPENFVNNFHDKQRTKDKLSNHFKKNVDSSKDYSSNSSENKSLTIKKGGLFKRTSVLPRQITENPDASPKLVLITYSPLMEDFSNRIHSDKDFAKLYDIFSSSDENMKQRLFNDIKYVEDQLKSQINMNTHLVQCIMMSNVIIEFERTCTDYINSSLIEAYKCGQIDVQDLKRESDQMQTIESKIKKLNFIFSEIESLEIFFKKNIN